MALRELFAIFDFKADPDNNLEKLNKGLDSAAKGVEALAGALVGSAIVKGVENFFRGQIELGREIGFTAERLSVATDALQEFQYAGQFAGLSAEAGAMSLRFLARYIGEASMGAQSSVRHFQALGVAYKDSHGRARDVLDVTADIADKFQSMPDKGKRAAFALELFGRGGIAMVPLLAKGSAAMRELFSEAERTGFVLSQDYIDATNKVGWAQIRLGAATRGLAAGIAERFLPAIERALYWLKAKVDWLKQVTDGTHAWEMALGVLGGVAVFTFARIALKAAQLLGLVSGTEGGVWGMVKAFGKLGIYGAVIAGVAIAAEDLWNWLEDNNSVTGQLLDKLYGPGGSKAVLRTVKDDADALKNSLDGVLERARSAWERFFGDTPTDTFKWLGKTLWGEIIADIHLVYDLITALVKGPLLLFQYGIEKVAMAFERIPTLKALKEVVTSLVPDLHGSYVPADTTNFMGPLPLVQGGGPDNAGSGSRPNVTQHNTIHITPAPNATPAELQTAVQQGIDPANRRAVYGSF